MDHSLPAPELGDLTSLRVKFLYDYYGMTSLVSVKRHDKNLKQPLGAYSFIADCFAGNSE